MSLHFVDGVNFQTVKQQQQIIVFQKIISFVVECVSNKKKTSNPDKREKKNKSSKLVLRV